MGTSGSRRTPFGSVEDTTRHGQIQSAETLHPPIITARFSRNRGFRPPLSPPPPKESSAVTVRSCFGDRLFLSARFAPRCRRPRHHAHTAELTDGTRDPNPQASGRPELEGDCLSAPIAPLNDATVAPPHKKRLSFIDRRGARAEARQPPPARFNSLSRTPPLTTSKDTETQKHNCHRVTPLLAQRIPSRVTVTFGARRPE